MLTKSVIRWNLCVKLRTSDCPKKFVRVNRGSVLCESVVTKFYCNYELHGNMWFALYMLKKWLVASDETAVRWKGTKKKTRKPVIIRNLFKSLRVFKDSMAVTSSLWRKAFVLLLRVDEFTVQLLLFWYAACSMYSLYMVVTDIKFLKLWYWMSVTDCYFVVFCDMVGRICWHVFAV